ncbi:halo transducer protein (plasmid) [Haloferax mediterranei ATCC 33500]|uniref:Halo transducer protein n=1 Tax=Haloferax mediterranei (strain ATCC 33500 / DSM 1411 / JCM 8866 / NBRC 14739 / NCIMB 2177 / R-4) TaxID=523841 RepID=I3RBB7_HALMT|nr:hypothetical protein [Haloferax mediterranei]AFK21527.1 halo transducer protein [Haloferax mediterranei ATCC 33500]AHZ24420.1 halo transducer protein [Haloferax mediterranei ATCC 33500]ELZ97160.1 halo transducer protein [Haloferax mediterranei ATCC 33500]MDX5990096.1 halo transducer protein [Haloferax mediterranei ATCC 33500]QCQ76819.1 halo transducer protein [Haloferax mediterranei ATCC 33500]
MGQKGSEDKRDSIIGLSKSAATDAIVAEDETRSPATVSTVLEHVTEDGTVTRDGVDEAVTDTSMILSTAETRAELASIALSDARETAGDAASIDAVQSRLATFDSKVSNVTDRVDELGTTVQELSHWHSTSLPIYDVVTGLRHAASEAQTLTARADDIQLNIEEFEHWLSNHDVRVREVDADVDALEYALDDLEQSVERVADNDDNADDWLDSMLRYHVSVLLVDDVRAELVDLREMAARADVDDDGLEDGAARLDELDSRVEQLGDRLDELAQSEWVDEHDEHLASFRATLNEFEPPISWGAVQSELEQYRPERDA